MLRRLMLFAALLLLIIGSATLLQAGQSTGQFVPLPGRTDTELLTNGSFEIDDNTDKIPDGWKSVNTSADKSDKMKCDKPDNPVAHDGSCAFIFRGNKDHSPSNISQSLDDFSTLTDGSTLHFSAFIDPRSGTPGELFGKAQVQFDNNTKLTLKLEIPAAALSLPLGDIHTDSRAVADYVQVSASSELVLAGKTITRVKVKFSTSQQNGKYLIDAASLIVSDNTPTATPTPIPTAQSVQLFADNGSSGNNFGNSVAVSGDTVVVGAYFKDNQGAAYVFTGSGTDWTQQQQLISDDIASTDQFGSSVAIDGNIVVVGANQDNNKQGSAYVFTRSGTIWTQQQKLTASDAADGDYFGSSVAIEGNTILIGAWGKNTFQGAAYVFTFDGDTWSEQKKLTGSDGSSSDQFGLSLALSGDTALVGAFAKSTHKGAAYVFIGRGANWTEQQKLTASDAANNDFFGLGVGLSGDIALIGAKYHSGGGAVYVFTRASGVWTQQPGLLTPDDAQGNDSFGSTVAMSGSTAVISAENHNSGQGADYIFTQTGGVWSQYLKLTASDAINNDYFGTSAALDLNTAIIGVPEDDVDVNGSQGSAWVFTIP